MKINLAAVVLTLCMGMTAYASEQNYRSEGVVFVAQSETAINVLPPDISYAPVTCRFGFSQDYDSKVVDGSGTYYHFFNSPDRQLTNLSFSIHGHELKQQENADATLYISYNRPSSSGDQFVLETDLDAETVSGAFDLTQYLAAHWDADIHYHGAFFISNYNVGSEDIPNPLQWDFPWDAPVNGFIGVYDGDTEIGSELIGYRSVEAVPEPASVGVLALGACLFSGSKYGKAARKKLKQL